MFPPGWTTLVLILAAMFVYFLKMNYTSFMRHCPSASKHTILDFVTGKYLHLQHSEVVWEWDEPQVVGKTMTFRIKVRVLWMVKESSELTYPWCNTPVTTVVIILVFF